MALQLEIALGRFVHLVELLDDLLGGQAEFLRQNVEPNGLGWLLVLDLRRGSLLRSTRLLLRGRLGLLGLGLFLTIDLLELLRQFTRQGNRRGIGRWRASTTTAAATGSPLPTARSELVGVVLELVDRRGTLRGQLGQIKIRVPPVIGVVINSIDGDGFADGPISDSDCDDEDSWVYPYAAEILDGKDNDCDGSVDNNAVDAIAFYPDSDSDGYGDLAGRV